ncbi:Man1-Src1p-C-terminal domain-containing protein [Pseudomassariella vexata]|uniref:Man1-Src1p-C-terminal domain-domain-containing protein n=1 Tax=Pseudomassariella vexata TaxID=1141098 RepID=A0A1Y2E2N5_9PEZI|nr:Man1-Src1p-C-terminal domain-containing protein [Pseudomassariella vexata]ORY65803.1 Man1-Src1p-C-terminal domain-domain-containing protein [Pseudomassariella vexata]
MSDTESLDYLQPGFEPTSLTMPRLRSILVAHNIHYPSTAKKAQLVEIFNDNVVPQSRKILAQRARAKRSSKGITDAESSQSSSAFTDHDNLPPPSTRTRRSQSPRKATQKFRSEEPERQMMPPTASPLKRKPRAPIRQAQASDTDTNTEPDHTVSARKVRRANEVISQLKVESSDEGFFRRTTGAFTSDNPFQSGSSSPLPEKTPTNRRRTAGHENNRPTSRPTSSSSRRRTDFPTFSGDDEENMSKAFQVPVSRLMHNRTPEPRAETPEPMDEPGEEFTPEEQLELAAEEAIRGETTVITRRQPRQPNGASWSTSLSVMFLTLLSVFAGWYRQEKIAVGYCGVGKHVSSIPSEISVPEWAQSVLPSEISVPPSVSDALEPKCEPCPPHAYCYDDFTVRCEQDYILKAHPLALGGLVPLPPTCEPDGEKVRRVQAVANRAVEELRERTAKFECGQLVDVSGGKAATPAIEEQELKEIINQKRSKKMNNQEFEDLWGAAIGEIKGREEVQVEVQEVRDSGSVPNTLFTSTSLARISLTCAVRRSIRLGLARYRLQISALISIFLTALYGRSRFLANRAAAAQVPGLVDLVLERLANQKQVADDEDDPWLFLPHLRDDVLRSIHSLNQREKIWKRVRAVVEQNSNVRTGQREGRSGEVGRAWEWIGPSTGDSARRRKGGRVSSNPDVKDEEDSEMGEKSYLHQKWEESRPIY